MSDHRRYMITSALPYANGPIHLGHLAGAYLPGDIFARYCRLKKRDVCYICGSDEHGVPIMLRARAEGVSPQEVVDRYHAIIKRSFERFGMSFDYYGRTSSPVHHQTSQDFFRRLAEKNVFVLKSEKQLYDPEAKMFLADRFVRGTCPHCGYEDAYGDQCEQCGTSLSPSELINPRSAITNATPILKETTHWYLPLGKFQPALEKWIATHPEWRPNVLGQIQSWFREGLKDRAVTRDLPWGVPVPEDVARAAGVDATGKVLYVWFDAPIGYISATKEWAAAKGDPDLWKRYWQDPDTRLIHFIGKDNIVFHCLIFPAMLMTHGDFILPENVPANEFLNLEGGKLSTSRNYAVWLDDYLEKFEPDPLRYALASNMPETRDSDFSWSDFQARHNNELADILGNFVNRTFTFIKKYFDGRIPPRGDFDDLDRQLLETIARTREEVGDSLDRFQFKEATRRFMDLARFANKYFNDQKPWVTRKSDPERCATALNLCAQTARALAVLMNPFVPFTSHKIWKMLRLPGLPEEAHWDEVDTLMLTDGHALGELEILFRKIDDAVIRKETERLEAIRQKMEAEKQRGGKAAANPTITIEEFQKVELKTARVIAAEPVPRAKKLLKLQIDLGDEQRQLVAGLAEHYRPEELVGKTIVVVANLKPAVIRGIESQGMLLAVEDEGKLTLLTTEREVSPGKRVS
ncbi:MAG: methionine--tRNA ligase [Calditrichaeota bacterium]|nr:MAG: methionine--tRNA ligase [Calditrichota bacterium]